MDYDQFKNDETYRYYANNIQNQYPNNVQNQYPNNIQNQYPNNQNQYPNQQFKKKFYQPETILSEMQQYLNQFENYSYLKYYILFLIVVACFVILYILFKCIKGAESKSLEFIDKDVVPFLKKKSKDKLKKLAAIKTAADALITDNHSIQSDEYENFLKYKSKMIKLRQMAAAQRKKNRSKNRNLINYPLISSNSDKDYKQITKSQIEKLAKRECENLIDIDGIEDNEIKDKNLDNQV